MPGTAGEPDIQLCCTLCYREVDRLSGSARGRAEFARTQELLRRLLPRPPAVVLDVGGGPGAHAHWLAADSYTVHLIDLIPAHAREARASGAVASACAGDAQRLPVRTGAADAVLLLGPLYHLTDRQARLCALREAARVTRPGGLVAAAAISRNAPLMDLSSWPTSSPRQAWPAPRYSALKARSGRP